MQTDVCPENWVLRRYSFWMLTFWLQPENVHQDIKKLCLAVPENQGKNSRDLHVVLVNIEGFVLLKCFFYLQIFCAISVHESCAFLFQSFFLVHCFLLPVLAYVMCSMIRISSQTTATQPWNQNLLIIFKGRACFSSFAIVLGCPFSSGVIEVRQS